LKKNIAGDWSVFKEILSNWRGCGFGDKNGLGIYAVEG